MKRESIDQFKKGDTYILSNLFSHSLSNIENGTVSLVLKGKERVDKAKFDVGDGLKPVGTQ